MPVIAREGFRLYFETEGTGPPVLIHHGFMSDLSHCNEWHTLLPDYQRILFDARGHGHSDKPHQANAYSLAERTLDVIAILDGLGIDQAHFLGYSMGGWVGLGLAAAQPQRFRSLIVGGIGPEALSPEPSRFWREPFIEALRDGMPSYCEQLEAQEQRELSFTERTRLLALDHEAMIAQLACEEEPDFRRRLATLTVDMLIYVGEQDMHHETARTLCHGLQRARFLSIPNSDHGQAALASALLVREIRAFLAAH